MAKLTKKDIEKIIHLRGLFPPKIEVKVRRSVDGGFYAEVLNSPGCFTEADTLSELIEMVNDAMRSYFEIPQIYISYMPNYLPPIKLAQDLDVFPVFKIEKNLKLELTNCG